MNQRGSLLIASLWAVSIFSIMSTSLVFNASQGLILMKRQADSLEAQADFISAMNHAASLMNEDPFPHEDSKQDAWFGKIQMPAPFDGRMTIALEDEESKININTAPEYLLKAFFKEYEKEFGPLKGSAKDYAAGIAKFRSQKRFQSLQELFFLEDFEPADFSQLQEVLTVFPDQGLLNLNTAKPVALRALIQTLSGDQSSKLIFSGRLEEACRERCDFLSAELYPEKISELLKLPRTPFMQQLVQDFLSKVTLDSETFHIKMLSGKNNAEAVFRFRAGALRPEVLYWHEE